MTIIRQRTRNLLLAGGIGAMTALLIASCIIYFGYHSMKDSERAKEEAYQKQIAMYKKQLEEQQSQTAGVYVATRDMPAGTKLTEQDLVAVNISKKAAPDNAVDLKNAVGKLTKVTLKKNTSVTEGMLFEEGITPGDLRLQEFSLIQLPSKLKPNDFVDVRIKFPTGQDYIVLAKKKVKDLANGTVWHEMNEQEILTISSAIVDAYLENAEIYSLVYIDPYMQDKAIVTYPPNQMVLDLIDSDPNIVKVASTEMERRNRVKLEKALKEMDEMQRQKYSSGQADTNREKPLHRNDQNSPPPEQAGTSENAADNVSAPVKSDQPLSQKDILTFPSEVPESPAQKEDDNP